jgi:uncharacterized protein
MRENIHTQAAMACDTADQPMMITALLRRDAYPHPADDLRLHETHSSWVILAGPYAYKLKKPVDLGFLDFTTVDRRRADCEEEVRLNRRFSPDVYLGIVEVTEENGRYRVGVDDQAGEPAVWMRRLPEDGMLPEMLARGAADSRLARRIGQRLARFHATADTGLGVDEHGSPSTVAGNWKENFDQMATFVGRTISPAINEHIRDYVEGFLHDQQPLLERRVADGRVRDGHGDLHAASLCIVDGRIQMFDSLQFAPRFRCSDVAAEVAFLAMDFEHHGRADLAWSFVDEYVRVSGDAELPELLDFYACYRAYVRGKVRSLRLAQSGVTAIEDERLAGEAKAYLDLAWAHAGGVPKATLLVTMGLPASGKTTLARGLARRLGSVHLSSDIARKTMAGVQLTQRQSDSFGQGLYDPDMTRRTYTALRRQASLWLGRGRSVVLDATYGSPEQRRGLQRLADGLGAHLIVLLCHADDATLRARLASRAHERGVVSDARLELWSELRGAFVEPEEPELVRVDATLTPDETLEHALDSVRATLAERRAAR